jgi:hypothetical protein
VRGLVPEVVELKLREKLNAASRLEESRLQARAARAAKHKGNNKEGKRK